MDCVHLSDVRINRYIMECKLNKLQSALIAKGELIDTLWNVNDILHQLAYFLVHRINRYIMECKLKIRPTVWNPLHRINRYIMECKLHISTLLFSTLL